MEVIHERIIVAVFVMLSKKKYSKPKEIAMISNNAGFCILTILSTRMLFLIPT